VIVPSLFEFRKLILSVNSSTTFWIVTPLINSETVFTMFNKIYSSADKQHQNKLVFKISGEFFFIALILHRGLILLLHFIGVKSIR